MVRRKMGRKEGKRRELATERTHFYGAVNGWGKDVETGVHEEQDLQGRKPVSNSLSGQDEKKTQHTSISLYCSHSFSFNKIVRTVCPAGRQLDANSGSNLGVQAPAHKSVVSGLADRCHKDEHRASSASLHCSRRRGSRLCPGHV
jgi:hypothetical protein